MVITFVASYLPIFMFAAIPVLWWIDGRKLKETTIHAIASSLLAWIISQFLKDILATTRPYLLNGKSPLTLTRPTDGAFPSSHMAATVALGISLYFHYPKLGFVFLVASLVIGIARIQANVHYPADILGGAVLGIMIAAAVHKIHLFRLIKKPRG